MTAVMEYIARIIKRGINEVVGIIEHETTN